jgi:hypothetical protein
MKLKHWSYVIVVLVLVGLAGCANQPPLPESDSSQEFAAGQGGIPVDDNVYTITGKVVGEVESLVRQTSPGQGFISGTGYGVYGSYFGPEFDGKGFVRLEVMTSDSRLAPKGSIVILKVTDTKASVLLPGDTVCFKCRHQYEAIAAVRNNETFDQEKLETWEIDYCRLVSPVVSGQ